MLKGLRLVPVLSIFLSFAARLTPVVAAILYGSIMMSWMRGKVRGFFEDDLIVAVDGSGWRFLIVYDEPR